MQLITAAVASLLALQVYAAPGAGMRAVVGARNPILEQRVAETAYDLLERRQSDSKTANDTKWDSDTTAACTERLAGLDAASNPSGMALCYNLVKLDTKKGEFMADLRLFEVSAPSGAWSGIPLNQMQGGIKFNGATASEINGQKVASRDLANPSLSTRQSEGPKLHRTYQIVGKINKDQMVPPMTIQKIEPLIMPIFSLSATDATGRTVTTNISSNEASFVHGIFANEVVMSKLTMASIAVDNIKAELAAGTVAFILPGVNLLIFPVGLVVTSVWMVVGFAIYGFGTYERYNYRETYRRRKAMSGSKSYATRI
ncbi:hypothetical protein F4808DRAFT_48515 [Astrocystis sublimbata]|nr:hypothetical protein F4808DRAFT_48515 [Astrocystis sublimbata]